MAQLQLKKPIIFFDLETTGVDPSKDKIVELAFVKINPNGQRDTYEKRVNPGMPIPAEASAVHGIFDADVAKAPLFKQIASELYDWMKGCDLGGYNSSKFDLPLLAEEFLRVGIQVDFTERSMVDVQQIFFKMESRTLSAAYQFYCQKELTNAHSAAADINATIDILEAQLDKYEGALENDIKALHQFTNTDVFLDYGRRIILKDNIPYFNFGKHKGKKVEDVFTVEQQYYDWMMQSDFSLHTKQKITEILNAMKLKKLQNK